MFVYSEALVPVLVIQSELETVATENLNLPEMKSNKQYYNIRFVGLIEKVLLKIS